MREVQEVERTDGEGPVHRGNTIEKHPSFAMIGISRRSSSQGDTLFGSSIQHNNTIAITIERASREVGPFCERFGTLSGGRLIEIEMSQAQFAEMITTPNFGSGVPCTIRSLGYEMTPEAPHHSRREEINKGVQQRMNEFATRIKEWETKAKELLSKPTIAAKDRKDLAGIFNGALQELTSNLPYLAKVCDEAVEKSVQEAKTEIDAFITTGIHRLGMEALAEGKSLGPAPGVKQLTAGITEGKRAIRGYCARGDE